MTRLAVEHRRPSARKLKPKPVPYARIQADAVVREAKGKPPLIKRLAIYFWYGLMMPVPSRLTRQDQ